MARSLSLLAAFSSSGRSFRLDCRQDRLNERIGDRLAVLEGGRNDRTSVRRYGKLAFLSDEIGFLEMNHFDVIKRN